MASAPGSATLLCAVLGQLGHPCVSDCAASDPAVGAVRFAWRNPRRASSFLVVDLGPGVARAPAQSLLQSVNQCTRKDGIRVLARHPNERGLARSSGPTPWTVLS
ncbi:hypothetical protein V3N99_04670 [Dermatophilaceae bacterium Soc4.6]